MLSKAVFFIFRNRHGEKVRFLVRHETREKKSVSAAVKTHKATAKVVGRGGKL